ncbi:hypothetical protein JHK87_053838 [Glycine soja]|nr:hypothetical protein JHK87_053838 [Glycine soja]
MSRLTPSPTNPVHEDRLPFFNQSMELVQPPTRTRSRTLGDLLKRVEDAQNDTPLAPPHHVLDLSSSSATHPFVLSFTNLTYNVNLRRKFTFFPATTASAPDHETKPNGTKTLLNDISGEARDGEIMAVLGASGSGKSTLIDALADRISKESLRGTVKLNGDVLESSLLKVISAYVMQDDLLFPMLTVEETLMFAAEFRLPRSFSKSKKKARVQALIDQLGLRSAASTVIGDEGHRGVSGGERRRVSIGTDIIHDPIAQAQNEYDSKLSLKDAISASISRGKLVSGTNGNGRNNSTALVSVPAFANSFWMEMLVIGKRSLTNSRRMPELFGIRLGAVLVTGAILATIFWHLDDSPKGVQERVGFFAFAMSTTFYTCAEAMPVFLQERYIFMRETAHNAYRRSSYVLAHAIISLPSLLFLSLAFAATTFWAVGMTGGTSGFLFYFITILASFWAGNSFVTFLSGVVSHVMIGFTVVVAILAYFLLFSGFFISRDRIPPYWIWFHYLSLVKYPYEGVLQNEFDVRSPRCFVRGIQMFENTPLGMVPEALKVELLKSMSQTLGMNITRSTCVVTGEDVLKQQGITQLTKWNCLWITLAWGFFFRFLFYLALLFGSRNKRR